MAYDYALIAPNGEVLRTERRTHQLEGLSEHAHKARWLPLVERRAAFDPISQVCEDAGYVVEKSRVVRTYNVRPKNASEIAAMREAKIAEIKAEFRSRSAAPITYAVARKDYLWHADADAVGSILAALLVISGGSRTWTPKDALSPVKVTLAELSGLGAAIASRNDVLFAAKKAKEAAVAALTDPASIAAFPVKEGW